MKVTSWLDTAAVLATFLLFGFGLSACGGSGNGGSSPSASSSGGAVGATVTLTSSGVSNAAPRIPSGTRVRFTNNDSRAHQVFTTPHGTHTDCPALNEVGMLQPGQSADSGALNDRRGCGFHDHLNPDDERFRGQVIVGFGDNEPDPAGPVY